MFAQSEALTIFVADKSMFELDEFHASLPLGPNGEQLSADQVFERFVRYYNSKNIAVLEVPYGDDMTAIMLLPASCSSSWHEIAALIPGSVLRCEGLEHREPPSTNAELHREEL